jgi:trimeric autotransporter adhesin
MSFISFDFNVLGSYYASGASLSASLQTAVLRNGEIGRLIAAREQTVIPPWQQREPLPDKSLAQRVFSQTALIDPNDPLFDRVDLDDDSKTLFAAYKALGEMLDIANYAQTSQGKLLSTLVDAKFQSRVAELETFINGANTNTVSLVTGILEADLDSSIVLGQDEDAPRFNGAVILENRDDPIPGLTATDQFTLQTDDGTTVRSVTITLSDISADPNDYTLDNISAHVNTEAVAAGISTLMYTERYDENEYGFRIDVGFGETASLTAAAATESSAVYVAGFRGQGPSGGGFVTKVDDLGAADPTEVFYNQIDTTSQTDAANGVAVDSTGAVYVVGKTAGDLGDQQVDPENNDVFLNKYDAAGNIIFTRRLGATEDGAGFAVAVDGNDNVIIAGQARGTLTSTAVGGNLDTFVTQFDSDGQELWTRQAGPFLDDVGLSVTVNSSNEIFVAGLTRSEIASGEGFGGGDDAFVTKLDSSGTLVYNRQFGDAGNEQHTAVAVDSSGNVFLAGTDDGAGFVRRYGDGDATAQDWEFTGTLGTDGSVTGLSVDNEGDVYVSGYTSESGFFGGTTPVTAHAGGTDGFVAKLANADGAVSFGTFLGTTDTDRAFGVAVDPTNEEIYVSGETAGTLAGETSSGITDGFLIKLDSTFNEAWRHQFGGGYDQRGSSITFDSNGTNVLSRMGLPIGEVPADPATSVTSVSTVRPGQYFYISVDNGPREQVIVDDDDSFGFLSFKIRNAIGSGGEGTALFVDDDISGRFLRVSALNGHKIELIPGPDGLDALSGIGLRPEVLFGEIEDDGSEDFVETNFGLGLTNDINLLTESAVEDARTLLEFAQVTVKRAFRLKTEGPDEDFEFPSQPPQRILDQISSMQAALARLQSISFNANSTASQFADGQGSLFNLLI